MLLAMSMAGCDPASTGSGLNAEVVQAGPRLAILEDDMIASQDLARTEFKLRNPNSVTQKDAQILEKLREKYPDHQRILNCLLQIYDQQKNWNAMARLLETFPGANLDPEYADAYGATLIKIGRFEEAKLIFANLCSSQPHSDTYSLGYAHCLFHTGDVDLAASELDKLVQVAQDEFLFKVYSLRGLVALQQQDFAKARESFEKTLDLSPNDLTALLSMSRVMRQSGDLASADKYELRAQAVRNDDNRKTNDQMVGGTMTGAIRDAMLKQDYVEARKLIEKLMPLADESLRRELNRDLYLIQEAESGSGSSAKQTTDAGDKQR